LLGLKSDVKIC